MKISAKMHALSIDSNYLVETLLRMLEIPSPAGYTDEMVRFVGGQLEELGLPFEVTRRGAIRATLKGRREAPSRAIVAHVDTLGAMVRELKPNGRLAVAAVGTWPARFAEGARVTIITPRGSHRGTLLPLKASGHIFHEEVDTQPAGWDYLELRIDERCTNEQELHALGLRIGDYVAIDARPEVENGFINARHLDNKAGVACLLAAIKCVQSSGVQAPVDCYPLFTIFEEVGSGASGVLHGDISEMVAVDNATPGPNQNAKEFGATIAMMDESGPFDYHLTQKLLGICEEFDVPHQRDVMRYYRCDAASAIEAGNDIRTALLTFGVDASHGYERTHLDALHAVTAVLSLYIQSEPTFQRDQTELGPLQGFPTQPSIEEVHQDQARWIRDEEA